MRIAMIGQKGLPARFGGVEAQVEQLTLRLVRQGFFVTVYSRAWYTKQREPMTNGVHIVYLPSLHTKHFDTITHAFFSTIHAMTHGYDIIHYHGVGPALVSMLPRIFTPRIRVITTFHSIDRKQKKWGLIARWFLKLGEWCTTHVAHTTIAVSDTLVKYIRSTYRREAIYIPNGITVPDTSLSINHYNTWSLVPQQYLLTVSRLIPDKGIHYLITAYKTLCHTAPHLMRKLPLVIVGDDCYTKQYADTLKTLARGANIIFTGFQSGNALQTLYANAKIFIHPSDSEGMPTAVLEAMSFSLPVLVSDIPEHQKLISDPDYQFARGQATALAKQLMTILQAPAETLTDMGAQNRKTVATLYNWDTIIEQYRRLYQTTMETPVTAEVGLTV